MATFTPEEIQSIRSKGNEYCSQVWLGLYEGTKPTDRDEHTVHTLMLDKYERKRYYMDPSVALRNGYNNKQQEQIKVQETTKAMSVKPLTSIISEPRPVRVNGEKAQLKTEFVADFAHADIFNASNNNATPTSSQPSFANFDNNPVFNNTTNSTEEFSIFNLQFTNCGPVYKQVPLFPKMNLNRWSMPFSVSNMNAINAFNNSLSQEQNKPAPVTNGSVQAPPPSEDRYAALKDLDNALKAMPVVWNSDGSNTSLYSSPATAGSLASPQSSSYGSPSQGQFMNLFPSQDPPTNMSNPFNISNSAADTNGGGSSIWGNTNGHHPNINNVANPFRTSPDTIKMNISNDYNSMFMARMKDIEMTQNPFKDATNRHSTNPFF